MISFCNSKALSKLLQVHSTVVQPLVTLMNLGENAVFENNLLNGARSIFLPFADIIFHALLCYML